MCVSSHMTRQTPSSPTTAFHLLLTLDSATTLRDPANERRRGSSSGGASFVIHRSTSGVVVSLRPSIRIADGPVAAILTPTCACGGGTFSSEKKSSSRGIALVEALVGPSTTIPSSSASSSATSIATGCAAGDELVPSFLPPSGSDASVYLLLQLGE